MRLLLKPGAFLVSIFLMAGVYELMWVRRPDYFRAQSGVNLLPLDLVEIARSYSAYSNKKALPDLLQEQSQDAATKQIIEIYEKFRIASIELSREQADFDQRQKLDAQDYKGFESSQWTQYEEFVKQKTAPIAPQIEKIKSQMQAVLAAAGAKNRDDLPAGGLAIRYSSLEIELAKLELASAKAEADARDYGLHHLIDFQHQAFQQAYITRSGETEQMRRQIFAQQTATDALHEKLYQAFVSYLEAAKEHLGYWDFLYFSVGAATTATFGDIAPNSSSVRMLVCLQVLGSIVFSGLMINDLANRAKQNRA